MKRFRLAKGLGCGWNLNQDNKWGIGIEKIPECNFWCFYIGPFFLEKCECCA